MDNNNNGQASLSQSLSSTRWYALAILFLVSVVNTIDKMLIPALAEPLRLEFDLSDSELGLLVGLVFSVAYAIMSIPMGLMINRLNRVRLLSSLLIIWSLLTLVSSKTSSYLSLALCRMGVAAAESGGNPTSLSLIGDYFPPYERGKAIGIFSANGAVASILVFSVSGVIAAEHGWRAVFIVASIPGIILGFLVLFSLKEPVRGNFDPTSQNENNNQVGLAAILKSMWQNKPLLWLLLAAVFIIVAQAGSSAFMAAFFVRVHELPLEKAGLITGVVLGVGFAIGTISGGIIADRKSRAKPGGGCLFISLTTFLAVPMGLVAFTASSVPLLLPFLFLYQMLGTCYYGATMAAVLEISPSSMRGAIITYATLVMNLGGYGFGPQIIGGISDLFNAAGVEHALRWALVAAVGIMAISALLYLIAGRKIYANSISPANAAMA